MKNDLQTVQPIKAADTTQEGIESRSQIDMIRSDPHEKEYDVFLEAAAASIDGWEA